MRYISTRGEAPVSSFEETVMTGLASDGGLYVPERIPKISHKDFIELNNCSYAEAAFRIMRLFIDDIDDKQLKDLIKKSYTRFCNDAIVPIKQIGKNKFVLELFNGPTLAFKDIALQLMGNLIDYFLKKRGEKAVIMGATSGDTGSAAISGFGDCKNLEIFILHPNKMISEIQRRQMTTVKKDNVHNIAIKGNFDDAQAIVKESFNKSCFIKGRRLIAINSINWARILAQTVYYIVSAISVGAPYREISFTVPSANFGNIFAGYIAYKMGLPIRQLVIATNVNNILHRIIEYNDFSRRELVNTIAPAMDIVVSSNFERLLFYAYNKNSNAIKNLFNKFNNENYTIIDEKPLKKLRNLFYSTSVNDKTILSVISDIYKRNGIIVDPHTAIGLMAAERCNNYPEIPMITMATAHPAKFYDTIIKAGIEIQVPNSIKELLKKEERYCILPANINNVHSYMFSVI
ncbi:Threonine synthase [Candidatus Portiera aleyrodidarum]|uniref:Threonine synthase n=1 Tax=Candidatus Portiera aleyrodidarum TV TaxID=1297582 RepID=A0A8D3X7D5_9GAMM|nr:threonine synthase [Candidatus Portiera aleyrodidarum]AGI27085.1 L-threonine synthase [Candidatus Portiera aleyrodidarum TV]CEI59050.1 Threonine synthase [Candidatus Portiera aleyrodidarum]